ncbi:MAG: hypothetical protein ACLR0P_13600 [Oscillospiraceae bacterium]
MIATSWTSSGPCRPTGWRTSLLLERGGVTYGIFGLMGTGLRRLRPHIRFCAGGPGAGRPAGVWSSLEEQGAAVYHLRCPTAGPDARERKSEDQQLAREVEGIDLIVSGHTHTALHRAHRGRGYLYRLRRAVLRESGDLSLCRGLRTEEKTLTDYQSDPH